jgi:hypothetical protein
VADEDDGRVVEQGIAPLGPAFEHLVAETQAAGGVLGHLAPEQEAQDHAGHGVRPQPSEAANLVDGRFRQLGDARAVVNRGPIDVLAVPCRRTPAARTDEVAHNLASHGPLGEGSRRTPRPQENRQLLGRRLAAAVDERTLLERELIVVDRVNRADRDALSATPARLRPHGKGNAVADLEHVGSGADLNARAALNACFRIDPDLAHLPPLCAESSGNPASRRRRRASLEGTKGALAPATCPNPAARTPLAS